MSSETIDRDRDPDLERMLRTTMARQAATITDGPRWTPRTPSFAPRRRRATWLPVAAAVASVLVVAGGFAAWTARDDDTVAGGAGSHAVQVPLPAAWRHALHPADVQVDGHHTEVQAMSPAGTAIVSWSAARDATGVAAIAPDGAVRHLYTVPAPSALSSVDADDTRVVLTSVPDDNLHAPASTPRRVVVVDLRTGRTSDLARRPGVMPPGYVVNAGNAALQDGTVYWAAVPAGQTDDRTTSRTPGVIVSYDLASGKHRVVGRGTYLRSNEADPRGVFWAGGSRRPGGVPARVAAFTTRPNHFRNAVRNGSTWAWDQTAAGTLIGWTNGTSTRVWRQDIAARGRSELTTVVAVSGPFVYVVPMNGTDDHLFVLDARTGAYADTGLQGLPVFAAADRLAIYTRDGDHSPYKTIVLDPTALPGLRR